MSARNRYTKDVLDVVPPGGENPSSFGNARKSDRTSRVSGRLVKRREAASPENRPVSVGPRTVQVDWRLPARLRRPIRQELERERRKRRQRQAIVQFERRPVISSVPTAPPNYRRRLTAPRENVGAEHHTGDVYRHSRPEIAVTVPPYRGSFARRFGAARRAATNRPGPVAAQPSRQAASSPTQSPRQHVARPMPARRRTVAPKQQTHVPVTGERDMPFNWAEYGEVPRARLMPEASSMSASVIAEPKRRFALPLHFSIWPFGRGGEAEAVPVATEATSKKKRLIRQ